MNVSGKTSQRYIRRFRTMMAESNNQKVLDAMYYEIDIIWYGGVEHGGKRGKGSDKTQILMILSTDVYNKYPRYMKLHILPNHKADSIKKFVSDHMFLSSNTIVSCDNDPSFKWLKNVVDLNNAKVYYTDDDHKLFWLNIIAGNFENNLKNIDRKISQKRHTTFHFRNGALITGILARTLLVRCVNILEPLLQSRTSSLLRRWTPMLNILKHSKVTTWKWNKLYKEYSIFEDGNAVTISILGFESMILNSNHYWQLRKFPSRKY